MVRESGFIVDTWSNRLSLRLQGNCLLQYHRPLACTASRFCHKLSERALFLSCSCNAGGDMTPDPPTPVPSVTSGERLSRCRRCSISCCLEVSLYSWYRKAGGTKDNESGIRSTEGRMEKLAQKWAGLQLSAAVQWVRRLESLVDPVSLTKFQCNLV